MTPPNFSQLFQDISLSVREAASALSQSAVEEVQAHPVETALTLTSLFIAPAQPTLALRMAEEGGRALARIWGISSQNNAPFLSLPPYQESLLYLPPSHHTSNSSSSSGISDPLLGLSLGSVFGPMISRPLVRSLSEYLRHYRHSSNGVEKHAQTCKPAQPRAAEFHQVAGFCEAPEVPMCR